MNITFDNIRDIVEPLRDAQFRHTEAMLVAVREHGYIGDDGTDYLRSALELSARLLMIHYDCDVDDFVKLMSDPVSDDFVAIAYASDGIAEPIYEYLTTLHGEGWEDRAYPPYTEPAKYGL